MKSALLRENSKDIEIIRIVDKEETCKSLSKRKGTDVSFVSLRMYNTRVSIHN
jgi:hypothetical protein